MIAITAAALAAGAPALPIGLTPAVAVEGAAPVTHQATGYLHVTRAGTRVGLYAEGLARLAVDRRVIASTREDGGESLGAEPLPVGVHRVVLQYAAAPGKRPPVLKWQFADEAGPRRIPTAALAARALRPYAWRLRRVLEAVMLSLGVAWIAALAWAVGRRLHRAYGRTAGDEAERRAAAAVLGLALLVYGYAVWWGLPGGWAQDELGPTDVLHGLERRFSYGWSFLRYPPFHFFLLALAYSPLLLLGSLGFLDLYSDASLATLSMIGRALTVAMSVGTTAIAYLCGRVTAGARTGVFAALAWTLVLPAAYYGKTVNLDMPATFWFALSLLGYIRAIGSGSTRDHVLFGVAAAAAVSTKDQTYGFYALPALHLAFTALRRGTRPARLAIAAGTAAGAAAFAVAQNLVFNWYGFVRHLDAITGGYSEGYRMIDSGSLAGQLWLLRRAGAQMVWSLSWPGTIVAACATVAAFTDAPHRRVLAALLAAAVSYYVTFIAVVGYHYDRFFIPVCFVLAIVTGRWLDRMLPDRAPRWRTAAAGAVLLYMSVRTASLNVLMAEDGRYDVEAWLRDNVRRGTTIAVVEFGSSLPRLHDYVPALIHRPLTDFSPRNAPLAVVTTEYRDRFPEGAREREWYDALVGGRLGYRVVYRYKASPPLALVARESTFLQRDPSFTTLHKINPEVIVLAREGADSANLQPMRR